MVEAFQNAVLYAALAGLAFLLPILIAKSKTIFLAQERLLSYWRSLTPFGRIVALSFLTASILYGGSKTNSAPRLTMMLPISSTKMSYAERKAQNWNIRGAWKDSFWLKFADTWCFPFSTNHLRGVEVISYGELWQTPLDNNAVASLGAPAEIVPTISSFSYELTPSNSYRFIWENAAIGRDTNNLLTASLELFRNGDILTVTNGVATYKERELPTDWGDPNEDGFYGNDNTLPVDADEGAYYWIDLVVSNATAKVKFVGEGESNYSDPDFVAKENSTNRVVLLIGKPYTVTCDEAIGIIAKSDADINVEHISENEIKIIWPLQFDVSHETMYATPRATTTVPVQGGFIIETFPLLTGVYTWETNKCCDFKSESFGKLWRFSCQDDCYCTGCLFEGVFVYEGYRHPVVDLSCGCTHKEEPSATASISFSKSAVIFENCYTNAPNDIVPRRSTTNSLDIAIYGGPFGGSAVIDFDDNGKLEYLTQEAIPRSVSVAAEETVNLSFPFTAKEESASENDIKARLKFSENFTGDIIESEDEMTAVRVEVIADADWPENKNRHVFGPQEIISVRINPDGIPNSTLEIGGNLITGSSFSHVAYDEPTNLFAKVSIRGSIFGFDISTVAPERLEAIACREFSDSDWRSKIGGVPRIGDVAVGMVVDLRLLPDYVSFKNVFLQEGECEATNAEGFFVKNSVALLPHGPDEGALTEVKVSDFQNYAGQDFAAVDFGFIPIRLEEGNFQYNITNYWYVKSSGDVATRKNLLTIESQKYFLDINGTLSVEKYGCKIQRGTNNIINVIRSQK